MLKDSFEFRLIVIGAKDLDDVSTSGNLDTFVRIAYGCKSYQSTTIRRSGRNPTWNYEMSLSGNCDSLSIGIYDSGVLRDKLIGECTIDFKRMNSNDNRFSIPLTKSSKLNHLCGSILINLHFTKHGKQIPSLTSPHGFCHKTRSTPLPDDCNFYCPVLNSHFRSTPLFQTIPVVPEGASPEIPITRHVDDISKYIHQSNIPKSTSSNSLHSTGDSPRHSRAKAQFYSNDVKPNRRPPMYDKRMYPILPTKAN